MWKIRFYSNCRNGKTFSLRAEFNEPCEFKCNSCIKGEISFIKSRRAGKFQRGSI